MGKVFISYKQEERERMRPIADGLRALDVDVWFDEKLEPDRSFTEEIEGLVKEASAQIVCWSPEAVKSEWVRGEAEKGRQRGVLIAVMIEFCDLPAPFNMHHAEDLVGWAGNVKHPGWRKVVDAVGRKLQRPGLGELSVLQGTGDPESWKRWAEKYPADPFVDQAWGKAEELEISNARARMAQQRAIAQKAAEEQAARAADDAHRAALEQNRLAAERAADEARRASLDAQRLSAERLRLQEAAAAQATRYAETRYAPPPQTARYNEDVRDDDGSAPQGVAPKFLVPGIALVVVIGLGAYFGAPLLSGNRTPPAPATQVASQEAGQLTAAPPPARLHSAAPHASARDPAANLAGGANEDQASNDTASDDGVPAAPDDQIQALPTPASFGPPAASAPPPGVGRVGWAAIPSDQVMNQFYPAAARAARIGGRIVLDCGIRDDLAVSCSVLSESPTGYGFGNAAVRAAAALRANPTLSNGAPAPGAHAQVAVNFKTELLTAPSH